MGQAYLHGAFEAMTSKVKQREREPSLFDLPSHGLWA
jgi:hypothetical protein